MMIYLQCLGEGAQSFLQGQLTCNMHELKENEPQFTACCNLQGRVIFTTFITMKHAQLFLLQIPLSMKDIVITHLEKYAKVSKCLIQSQSSSDDFFFDKKIFLLNRIPIIYPETSEKIIAQRLHLHLIPKAMSFKKGCYLGQEVIARLHFKGTLKHRLVLGEIPAEAIIQPGEEIKNSQQDVTGLVVDSLIDAGKTYILFVDALDNDTPIIDKHAIYEII